MFLTTVVVDLKNLATSNRMTKRLDLSRNSKNAVYNNSTKSCCAWGIYDKILPTGFKHPRMHGFPKTHKQNLSLRPILSMVGSAQHQLAKQLLEVWKPVLHLYFENCILDSLTFAKFFQNLELKPTKTFVFFRHQQFVY